MAPESATAAAAAVTRFEFTHLPATWLVAPLLAVAVAAAWWGWRYYGPAPAGVAGRIARSSRSLALALLVLLAAGPAWRTTVTTLLPGRVVVVVDRSASMARTDTPDRSARIAVVAPLAAGLATAGAERGFSVDWQGMGGVTGVLPPGVPTATGQSSPLGSELERLVAERRPDLLVVVSDGRVTEGPALSRAAESWRGQSGRVAWLAVGSTAVEPELWIDEVLVNREAARDELEPVTVRYNHRALGGAPATVTLLVDGEEQRRVEVASATAAEAAAVVPEEVRLEAVFRKEGPARVSVRVEQGGRSVTQDLEVQVRARKLKVLILGHRPTYELRYLAQALRRDSTVEVEACLSDGRWRRWTAVCTLPSGPERPLSPAELAQVDVVVLADLPIDALRPAELSAIETAVRKGGMGLLWMPGETGAIAGYQGTRLGALIPATLPDASTIARAYLDQAPHRLQRSAVAVAKGLLEPASERDWPDLPPLLGACPVGEASPGADVLATDQDGHPLVVTRAYDAGHALLLAVDDTWRWRRNVGDTFLHRFHSQLLRFLASGRRNANLAWRLFASPRRVTSGEAVQLSLVPVGAAPEAPPAGVTVSLTGPGGQELPMRLAADGAGFSLHLSAPEPGAWIATVTSGIDPRTVDRADLQVLAPGAELRDPRADLPAITAFAEAVGGQVFTDVPALLAALPRDLRQAESVVQRQGWWDTPWALLLITLLLSVDWGIRRWGRLP